MIDNAGVLEIDKMNIDYSITNHGGLQLGLPADYSSDITYDGTKNSFFNLSLDEKITNYTCKVKNNSAEFVSLPYSDFNVLKVPKKYVRKVGNGSSIWIFNLKEDSTFNMEYSE